MLASLQTKIEFSPSHRDNHESSNHPKSFGWRSLQRAIPPAPSCAADFWIGFKKTLFRAIVRLL